MAAPDSLDVITGKQELSDPVPAAVGVALRSAGTAARAGRASPRILRRMLALDDFEAAARRYLPRPIFGYVAGGVENERLAARQPRGVRRDRLRAADAGGRVRPHAEDDAVRPHLRRAVRASRRWASTAMAAYQGDLVLARAAAAANMPMIMSGASLTSLERVREEGPTAWFQAYLPGEARPITQLVERVARAGFDTLC